MNQANSAAVRKLKTVTLVGGPYDGETITTRASRIELPSPPDGDTIGLVVYEPDDTGTWRFIAPADEVKQAVSGYKVKPDTLTISAEILMRNHGYALDNILHGNINRIQADSHPSIGNVMGFFSPLHTANEAHRPMYREFAIVAINVVDAISATTAPAELTTMLRKMLEALDCAIRAWHCVPAEDPQGHGLED